MPLLLIIVGVIVAVLGLGAFVYGIPVKEFSFGNTLIVAGTTAIVGGLVIAAIGAMIRQLRHIAELLAAHPLPGQPVESFEAAAAPAAPPARVPFPSRPKPELREPPPAAAAAVAAAEERPVAAAAPMLRNPEAAAPAVEQFEIEQREEALPPHAASAELPESPPDRFTLPPLPERPAAPPPVPEEETWPSMPPRTERPAQPNYFDSMWPPESRAEKRPPIEEPAPEPPAAPAPPSEPVAILKSGVVDGMAYTLYVDGSIEAELPNGTLRFASIHELRDHLAKSS